MKLHGYADEGKDPQDIITETPAEVARQNLSYLHVKPGDRMPDVADGAPWRVVVIAEMGVDPRWQAQVSTWMVRSGCLYMMAWGEDCSSWDDMVDWALIEEFHFEDIPEERFVMTTWHEGCALAEVFHFCKHCAFHHRIEIVRTVLLHIAQHPAEQVTVQAYLQA